MPGLPRRMSLQRAAGPDVDTCFNFEAEPTKQSREGTITGPGRKPICELRIGSAVKFNYQANSTGQCQVCQECHLQLEFIHSFIPAGKFRLQSDTSDSQIACLESAEARAMSVTHGGWWDTKSSKPGARVSFGDGAVIKLIEMQDGQQVRPQTYACSAQTCASFR